MLETPVGRTSVEEIKDGRELLKHQYKPRHHAISQNNTILQTCNSLIQTLNYVFLQIISNHASSERFGGTEFRVKHILLQCPPSSPFTSAQEHS